MLDQEKTGETPKEAKETAARATWERPEMRRIDANQAETGGGGGADGGFS